MEPLAEKRWKERWGIEGRIENRSDVLSKKGVISHFFQRLVLPHLEGKEEREKKRGE